VVIVGRGVVAERLEGSLQAGHARLVPLGEPGGQPVQQEVDRPRGRRQRCRLLSGDGYLADVVDGGEATGVERRLDRLEVGLAGQRRVEWSECVGGGEQHPWHLGAPGQAERDPRAQQLAAGCSMGVQRPGRRDGQQLEGCLGRSGIVLGVRGLQRPCGTGCRLGRELDRSLQERRRGSQPAASASAARRALEVSRGVLVGAQHGLCSVPGAAVRVGAHVGGGGQCTVRATPVGRCGRPVDRRAHQRVAEADPGADLDQPGLLRGCDRLAGDAQVGGGAPQQCRLAGRVGRGDQEQELCLRPAARPSGVGSRPRPARATATARSPHPPRAGPRGLPTSIPSPVTRH
jgi:hypothetical protein